MNRKGWSVLLIIPAALAINGCASMVGERPSLLHASPHPWYCAGKMRVRHFGSSADSKEVSASALVYPNEQLNNLEVDMLPSVSKAKRPCANGAICTVKNNGGISQIQIRPARPAHSSLQPLPGMTFYSERLQFDPSKSMLVFSGGGIEWDWTFAGQCITRP